jgi:hypothetical protein
MRRTLRRAISPLLVIATAAAVTLPPSHIHLADHDHDHDHAVTEHTHWSPHGGASRLDLDDDDGRAIYVDHPGITSQNDTAIARPPTAVVALLDVPSPTVFTAVERPTSGNSPRDGPARGVHILRGPPLVL